MTTEALTTVCPLTVPSVPFEVLVTAVPLVAAPPAVVLLAAAHATPVPVVAVPAEFILALKTPAVFPSAFPTNARCLPASAPGRWAR